MNDFEKSFLSAFIGFWIGNKIDQTRFGIWFNNNPIVEFFWQLGKLLILLVVLGLIGLYTYILISGWGQ